MLDPRTYRVSETLRNGLEVTVRAVRPDDRARIVAAFEKLDPESIYTRFFSYKDELTDADLKRATEVDFDLRVVLLVTIGTGESEVVIGAASYTAYAPTDGGGFRAEVAFIVEEDYHGLGIASRLLHHLAVIARQRGIDRFEAEMLPENRAMLSVFERSGLLTGSRTEDGVIRATMRL
jgi:GNAT superfamily N-acetyltransferase